MALYLKRIVPVELETCDRAASFLQSGFWGGFKARFGWEARGFQAEWVGGESLPLLVMRRRLVPGLYFAYAPWGPELPGNFVIPPGTDTDAGAVDGEDARREALEELARALKPFFPGNTAFIRFDPPWYSEGAGVPPPPVGRPFYRAGADVQPPDTVIIDLAKPEAVLLGEMKPKWRYNIRLAERKGVEIHRADEGGLPVFYALFRETGRRDGIAIHGLEYYRTLFSHCRDYSGGGQEVRLYIAAHEGEPVAAIITLFRGPDAVYLYGASSDRKRNLMAPYLLQWRAMGDARAAGCLRYDLFGIPPSENPLHPMAGLYRFKTGFGGRIIHRPGSWDYACRPLAAGLFRIAEGSRKSWRNRKGRTRRTADFPSIRMSRQEKEDT